MTDAVEIVLVRHASTAWSGLRYCGRGDPPLSTAGRAEAVALAHRLASTLEPSTRIVSSPSSRAVATAEAIAAVAGGPQIECDPRWQETDFGLAEGLRFDEIARVQPELADAILGGSTTIDWPGGETAAALAARVARAWDDLIRVGRPAVVVAHAGPILHALRLARAGVVDLSEVPEPGTEIHMTVSRSRRR